MESHGAIILCGGASKRMGRDKALLPFGPSEVLLQRVVRLVGEVVPRERIVCVAAADQALPQLADGVQVVRDTAQYQGPLAGLATGMAALQERVEAAFVCGCDSPLVVPAVVARLFELLAAHQAVAVHGEERFFPLGAVYRADVLATAQSLLAAGERRLLRLLECVDTRRVALAEIADLDPLGGTFAKCNSVEEYERLVAIAFPRDSAQ